MSGRAAGVLLDEWLKQGTEFPGFLSHDLEDLRLQLGGQPLHDVGISLQQRQLGADRDGHLRRRLIGVEIRRGRRPSGPKLEDLVSVWHRGAHVVNTSP